MLADVNDDGHVNILDYQLVMKNWNVAAWRRLRQKADELTKLGRK